MVSNHIQPVPRTHFIINDYYYFLVILYSLQLDLLFCNSEGNLQQGYGCTGGNFKLNLQACIHQHVCTALLLHTSVLDRFIVFNIISFALFVSFYGAPIERNARLTDTLI